MTFSLTSRTANETKMDWSKRQAARIEELSKLHSRGTWEKIADGVGLFSAGGVLVAYVSQRP